MILPSTASRPDYGTTDENCRAESVLAARRATCTGTAMDNLLMLAVLCASGVPPPLPTPGTTALSRVGWPSIPRSS